MMGKGGSMTVFDTRHEPEVPAPSSARRIHELFETLAALVPGTPAVVAEEESLTYGELDRRANRLARFLRTLRGLGTEERVAVALERSAEAVVAVLAIWKAGGTWVPLDLSWPAARLWPHLEESGATFLIAREATAAILEAASPPWPLQDLGELPPLWQLRIVRLDRDAAEIAGQSAVPLRSAAGPEHLACLCDPGAEGSEPVEMTHRDLVQRSLEMAWLPGGRPGTGHRAVQLATGSALTPAELLLTLPQGAALHLPPSGQLSGAPCGRYLEERAITHLLLPPDLARSWASAGQVPLETFELAVVPGQPLALLRGAAVRAVAALLQSTPGNDPG
jgi:non-ribosomal peptide synthetase component F